MLTLDQKLKIFKIFGERMMLARELCGLTQIEAAKKLGYMNSSKLAKMEQASDTQSIPWWIIPEAAEFYGVSTDFLLGLSNEPNRDVPTVRQKQVEHLLEHATKAQDEAIRGLFEQYCSINKSLSKLKDMVPQIAETLEAFIERNPKFDKMPVGAKLQRLIETASAEYRKIKKEMHGVSQNGR